MRAEHRLTRFSEPFGNLYDMQLSQKKFVHQALTPNGKLSQASHKSIAIGTVVVLVASWAILRPAYFPGPREVLAAIVPLMQDGLLQALYVSLATNLQAIALSCLLTLPLAYLTVLPAVRPFVRILSKMRFLGLTGFVVLFSVTFGGGHALKLALLVFGMSVFLATSLYDVVECIPKEEFDYARTLRMGPWRSTYEIVILGRLDVVLESIRQNAAIAWTFVTMIEGLVRFEGGLGAMLLTQDKHLRFDSVAALQLTILVVGILQDAGFVWLRRLLCPYAALTTERT